MSELPLWVDVLTALLAVAGGLAALTGAVGLLRLPTFFQRAHAPTLGSTAGSWSLALATALQQSFLKEQVFFHALLIPVFVAVTAPITAIFLIRAGLFRSRLAGVKDVPAGISPMENAGERGP
jgi:multicomponent K+:H+ antiporter subunit G